MSGNPSNIGNENMRWRTCEGNLRGGSNMDFVEVKKAAIGHLLEVCKCEYDFESDNVFENRKIGKVSTSAGLAIYELIDIPQIEKEELDFHFIDSVDGFINCYIDGEMTKEQVVNVLVNWLDYYKQELSNFRRKLQLEIQLLKR